MLTAVVLGGAACLHDDLAAALELFTPDLTVAVNNAGRDHPGPVHHWASMHPEKFPGWIQAREAMGHPPVTEFWTAKRRRQPARPNMVFREVENWGGSSGLLAVTVALTLGCRRVVLCGVPLDAKQAHYDDPRAWTEAGSYRRAWLERAPFMPGVRSMSGFTRDTLGAPTEDWFGPCATSTSTRPSPSPSTPS